MKDGKGKKNEEEEEGFWEKKTQNPEKTSRKIIPEKSRIFFGISPSPKPQKSKQPLPPPNQNSNKEGLGHVRCPKNKQAQKKNK